MKTILIPTDFSAAAETAINFALELNKRINARIILFHSYAMPNYAADISIPVVDFEGIKEEAIEKLRKLKAKLQTNYPQMEIEAEFGDTEIPLASKLDQMVKAERADLVIMGTTGASGIKGSIFGSNAAAVIDKASCPVLVIPEKVKFKEIEKIVFATDYQDNDLASLTFLYQIAVIFDAELIILHISQTPQTNEYEPDLLEWFKHELKDKAHVDYSKISFHLLIAGDIADELQQYVEKNKVDIVSMSMRKRNTFVRMFDHSLTKKMVQQTHTPLLAFHTVE